MSYFESRSIGGYYFGIAVSSYREAQDGDYPDRIMLPLWSDAADFTHHVYIFCVDETLYHDESRKWKYYVLPSRRIPIETQRRGVLPYDTMRRLEPEECKRENLEKTILKIIAT